MRSMVEGACGDEASGDAVAPSHRASAIAGACIGVLDLKYGGQRPPMPPSPLR